MYDQKEYENDNNETTKEKRCLQCKKLLFDEKIPVCPRCRLKNDSRVIKGGKVAGGISALAILGANVAKYAPEVMKKIRV